MDRPFHILLVEDDENDVLLLKRAFQKAGLRAAIQNVADGDAAVDYLRGSGRFTDRSEFPLPMLLLLDLKLPRLGGHEILRWLRAEPALKRLPVVVLTSSKETRDVNLAYDLGANSYLIKPLLFDGLIGMMTQLERYWFHTNENPLIEEGRA